MPLLTFTDRTPTFSVLTTGLLEINKGLERQMGIDPAFWVAVALAYLEFLTERDVRETYIMRIILILFLFGIMTVISRCCERMTL